MKKLLLTLFCLSCFAPFAAAGDWGAAVKLGYGENDPKTMQDLFDYATAYNRELSKSGGIFARMAFFRGKQNRRQGRTGFLGENELKLHGLGTATEETYAIPVTVYYKLDKGLQNWSYWLGLGLSYIHTELDDLSDSKFFPHITGGIEYRFTQAFALGLDLKYNFSSKITKDGAVLSDRSGLSAALAGRFYF